MATARLTQPAPWALGWLPGVHDGIEALPASLWDAVAFGFDTP